MALGRAVLVLLVLCPLRACGAELPEPGLLQGGQWVWGVAKPLPLSRGKRADGGQEPSATPTVSSDQGDGGSVPPPAPGTNASLLQVPTTADPMDDSPKPDLPPSPAAPVPGTNASLLQVLAVSTTAKPVDETDSPGPDPLEESVSTAAPTASTSLLRVPVVSTTANPVDETDSPGPDPLEESVSTAAPSASTSLLRVLAVSTTAKPVDETDSPGPDPLEESVSTAVPTASTSPLRVPVVSSTADPMDETDPSELLLGSEPGPPSAPQKSITTTTPSWLTSPIEEGTVNDGLDSSPSTGPRSTAPPAFVLTTTGYKKPKKSGTPLAPTLPARRDTTPAGTAVPWEPSGVVSKCLLIILLLGLVAATFLVCTGVLGALLWRRARTGQRRFSRTEMVCISSLLPDAEAAAGPRPVPARRQRLLLPDGSSEPDGDNLTLSSFLPEHS